MVKKITLTRGFVSLVDDEDFEYLNKYKWHVKIEKSPNTTSYYAFTNINSNGLRTKIPMHRLILNVPKGLVTDHLDHNGLNNQRSNLRICSQSENLCNQRKTWGNTQYKGVSYRNDRDRFRAYLYLKRQQIYLGEYQTAEEAAQIRDKYAQQIHGGFALNFPIK